MVASTLKLPFEARSEVKLKLLRGFCRDVSIFERLDVDAEEQQTDICRHMGLQEVDPHEIIFSQGSSGDTAYCLLSGSVQIAVHGRHVRTLAAWPWMASALHQRTGRRFLGTSKLLCLCEC